MKDTKRLPPILFPLWLIVVGIHYFIRILMWLVGYWWCDDCGRRGSLKTDRYAIKYTKDLYNPYTKDTERKDKIKYVCNQCYVSKYADSKNNVEYVQKVGDQIIDEHKKERMSSIGQ